MVAAIDRLPRILEKMMKALLILLALLLPLPVLASGFYVPLWFEAVLWLLGTPQGWVVCGVIVVAVIALIVRAAK